MALLKFVHTSDWHLGNRFGTLPPQVQKAKVRSLYQAVTALVDKAISEKVHLFLIAGDLFDRAQIEESDRIFVRAQLSRLTAKKIAVFVIAGNHDDKTADTSASIWDELGVHYFAGAAWQSVLLKDLDVEIVGCGFDKTVGDRNLLSEFDHTFSAKRKIVLFHGAWQNFGRKTDDGHPFELKDVEKLPVNYLALGHYHALTCVLDTPQKKAYYAGSIEGLDFSKNELGERQAIMGTIDISGEVSVQPFVLPGLKMAALDLDITNMNMIGIDQALSPFVHVDTLLSLTLTGLPMLDVFREIPHLEEHYKPLVTYFKLHDNTIGLPSTELGEAQTYQALFFRKLQNQITQETDEQRKRTLRLALAIGLSAFEKHLV